MMNKDYSTEQILSRDDQNHDLTNYIVGGMGSQQSASHPADKLPESPTRRIHRQHMKTYFSVG